MGAESPHPEPSLDLFFETVHAFHRTAALKAAIELDLFTHVGEGLETPEALAQRCGSSQRGMRILCDYLAVIGFLTKKETRYGLRSHSRVFLDRKSPAYVGAALEFLLSPLQMEAFQNLAAVVRRGGTLLEGEGVVAPDHPVWVQFARAMAPLMAFPAELTAKALGADAAPGWKVLDVAAGHGLYGIAIARHNPRASIVAADWPKVLEVAKENARAAGVEERYSTIAGSAFEVEFGCGYDLVLLTNFLHHFNLIAVESFLSKVHQSLKPGGQVAILEFIPNHDRVSPPVPAQFAMMMLATTRGGDAYTFSDYQRVLSQAGFSRSELRELPPTYFRLAIGEK